MWENYGRFSFIQRYLEPRGLVQDSMGILAVGLGALVLFGFLSHCLTA